MLLTADPARHAGRALAAAQASMQAGAFGKALELLAIGGGRAAGWSSQSARADLLRGPRSPSRRGWAATLRCAAAQGRQSGSSRSNLDLARQTYLSCVDAQPRSPGTWRVAGGVLEVSRAARALSAYTGAHRRPVELLLDGLTRLVTDGPGCGAVPALRQAVNAFAAGDVSREEGLQWGWMGASLLWDDDAGHAIMARQVQLARAAGSLEQLPSDLVALALSTGLRGDFAAAASLIAESERGSRGDRQPHRAVHPHVPGFSPGQRGRTHLANQDWPSTRPRSAGRGRS